MPVTFTDERLLTFGADLYREIEEGESIDDYRKAIADLHQKADPIEAHEIRTGKGWDQWADNEFDEMVRASSNDMVMDNPMVLARLFSRKPEDA